jgi:hypothetical protein
LQVEVFTQIKIFKCTQWLIDESNCSKLEHYKKKSKALSLPIYESNYFKLEHLDKSNILNALNLPINECTSCNMFSSWRILINKRFGMHSIDQ